MAAGVAGVLLEAPADDRDSPPIPDLICDYPQHPPPHPLCGLMLFAGWYMSSGDINPGEQSPEGIYLPTIYITTAIPEQARAT